MTVQYEMTKDDLYALYFYYNFETEMGKLYQRKARRFRAFWGGAVFTGLISLFLLPLHVLTLPLVGVFYCLFTVFSYFSYHRDKVLFVTQEVDREIKAGKFTDLFCVRNISIEPEGLVQKTEFGDRRLNWNALRSVGETADHFFLEAPGQEFFTVPKRVFATPQHQAEFLVAVERFRQGQGQAQQTQAWYQSKDQVG